MPKSIETEKRVSIDEREEGAKIKRNVVVCGVVRYTFRFAIPNVQSEANVSQPAKCSQN